MYRIVDLQRVHMYSDPDNFCAEVSMANLGNGELVGVFAQNRGLFHTLATSAVGSPTANDWLATR